MAEPLIQDIVYRYTAKTDELESQLKAMQQQMSDTEKKTADVGKAIQSEIGTKGSVAIQGFTNIIKAAGGAISVALAVRKVVEFTKECINLAVQAQNIKTAFASLNNPIILNQLREAVKGTLSDITLMKDAIKANQLGIPLQELAKIFEFAKLRADQTTGSVDQLADALIDGIGRKSTIALKNVGISQDRFNTQVRLSGTYFKALGDIIDQELAGAGETIENIGDESERLNAQIVDLQVELGEKLLPMQAEFLKFKLGMVNALNDLFTGNILLGNAENRRREELEKTNAAIKAGAPIVEAFNKFLEEEGKNYLNNQDALEAFNREAKLYIDTVESGNHVERINAMLSDEKYKGYIRQIDVLSKYLAAQKEIGESEEEREARLRAAEKAEAERQRLLQERIALLKELTAIERETSRQLMSDQAAKIDAIKEKYEELAERALGNQEILARIAVDQGNEIAIVNDKYADLAAQNWIEAWKAIGKAIGEGNKLINDNLKAISDASTTSADITSEIFKELQSDRDNELQEADEYYTRLVSLAEGSEEDQAALREKWAAVRAGITQKYLDIELEADREQKLEILNGINSLFQSIDDATQKSADFRLEMLERQKDAGILSEQEYDRERNKILRKQAEREKLRAFFEIAIGTAINAVKAALNPVELLFVLLQGAIQAAVVAGTPIPKYRPGGPIKGRSHEQGGVLIEAEHGEYVVNKEAYTHNAVIVESINRQGRRFDIEDFIIMNYGTERLEKLLLKSGNVFDDYNIVKAIHEQTDSQNRHSRKLLKMFADDSYNSRRY